MARLIDLDQLARRDLRAIQARQDFQVPPVLREIQARLGHQAHLVIRGRRDPKATLVLPDLSVLLDR